MQGPTDQGMSQVLPSVMWHRGRPTVRVTIEDLAPLLSHTDKAQVHQQLLHRPGIHDGKPPAHAATSTCCSPTKRGRSSDAIVLTQHQQVLVTTYDVICLPLFGTGHDNVVRGIAGHAWQMESTWGYLGLGEQSGENRCQFLVVQAESLSNTWIREDVDHFLHQVERGYEGAMPLQPGVQNLARMALFGHQATDQDISGRLWEGNAALFSGQSSSAFHCSHPTLRPDGAAIRPARPGDSAGAVRSAPGSGPFDSVGPSFPAYATLGPDAISQSALPQLRAVYRQTRGSCPVFLGEHASALHLRAGKGLWPHDGPCRVVPPLFST